MAALLTFAAGSDVSAGAFLTLWLPIAFTIVTLVVWYVVFRRRRGE